MSNITLIDSIDRPMPRFQMIDVSNEKLIPCGCVPAEVLRLKTLIEMTGRSVKVVDRFE